MTDTTKVPKQKPLTAKVLFAALTILKERGGELAGRDVFSEVRKRVHFDDWEGSSTPSGHIRWEAALHWYSVDCVKAGFLIKKNGVWFLTPEGEETLKLGGMGLLDAARAAYKKWRVEQRTSTDVIADEENAEMQENGREQEATLDEIQQRAIEGLTQFVDAKNPYEFQDLVAALLRGMGYFTPFVAPRGKDGGVDIVAYRDPLGTVSPRIKIQIKHREAAASVQEVRQLMGLLQKDGDVGIFVSTGGFTADAKATARSSHVHVELVDLERFINLWQEFYPKLTDEDKARMPLLPVYFVAPSG